MLLSAAFMRLDFRGYFLEIDGIVLVLRHKTIIVAMEEKETGYPMKRYSVEVKRYCRTLDLKDDPQLIAEYRRRHAEGNCWPEIIVGIKEVGILEMDIYIRGNRLMMILEAPADLDLDRAMSQLATLPRQQEWEDFMSIFQQAAPGASSAEKWQPMERVFHLYD